MVFDMVFDVVFDVARPVTGCAQGYDPRIAPDRAAWIAQESIPAMTMTSPATARDARTVRRRPARVLTAVMSALVVAFAAPAWAAPSPAWAGSSAAAEVNSAEEAPPITFTVAPSGGGVFTPGQPFVVSMSATNSTAAAVAAGAVGLETSATPLADREAVQTWLAGSENADAVDTPTEVVLGGTALPAITSGDDATASVVVDGALLAPLTSGVYPLRARYESAEGMLTAVSVIVVRGSPGTAPAGVIVPITATPITAGLLTATELSTLTGDEGDLRVRLDAVAGTGAILAVDPAIVAAIRVLGTSAPASATRWLDDLMTAPNARFALQFGDADLAAQVEAGLEAPLTVTSLAPYMSASDFVGGGASTPTPAPTDTPSHAPTPAPSTTAGPTLPSLAQLTDVGAAPGAAFWPATGTAGAEVVSALAGQVADGTAPITLVDSETLAGGSPTGAWVQAGDARLLVYDADASRALRTAAESEAPVRRAAALAEASAFAALDVATAPDAPALFVVDRSTVFSTAALRETVLAATRLTGRVSGDLAALTAGAPPSVTVQSVPGDGARGAEVTTLLSDEATLAEFATILTDPSVLMAPERASILQVLNVGWIAESSDGRDAYSSHRAQTQQTLRSVEIQPSSDITLATTSAPLTFSVRNDLPWPVSLVLIATNNDPRLRVQATTPVKAGAAQNTRVKVPVEARVGSGESTLRLQLQSPTAVPIGGTVPVHVAVRAEWEAVGLVVGSILVAAMIVAGVIRTVRKLRRRRIGDVVTEDQETDA